MKTVSVMKNNKHTKLENKVENKLENKTAYKTNNKTENPITKTQKIIPFLWFNNNAEEAIKFYCTVFKNTSVSHIVRYNAAGAKASGQKEGTVMTAKFTLEGQEFYAINAGPVFKFTPGVSFFVGCKTADEVNALWKKLSPGGKILMKLDKYPFSERYGWLEDKFGVSWQLVAGDFEQKISPMLFYAGAQRGHAEEAIILYISLFKNSKISRIEHYSKEEGLEGTVKYAAFRLAGQEFMAMDSHNDAQIPFSEAVSLFVSCDTQKEIDDLWTKLSEGGEQGQCGWLKDKFGVSWQIVPGVLEKLLHNTDRDKSNRVMQAMLKMNKLDIERLKHAYEKE